MAHLRGFEPLAYRLGGGRSILLSYRCLYEIVGLKGECTSSTLGGECTILYDFQASKINQNQQKREINMNSILNSNVGLSNMLDGIATKEKVGRAIL